MAVNDFDATEKITGIIYPEIAKTFETTLLGVESAIRNAIGVSMTRGCNDFKLSIFGEGCDGKLTNSEVIAAIADLILIGGDV